MAKTMTKPGPEPKRSRGVTPAQAPTKKAPTPTAVKTLALRVNNEYAAWVEELRALNRTTQAGLFDQALAAFAEMKGFRKPPERT